MKLPPKEKQIIPPDEGWKQLTYYVVSVAFSKNNPIHRSIFFTGFLKKGKPAGYNKFMSEYHLTYNDAHYLRSIFEIPYIGDNK